MHRNEPIQDILKFMPAHISGMVNALPAEILSKVEEVRLRLDKPLVVSGAAMEYFLDAQGQAKSDPQKSYKVTAEDLRSAVQLICNFSIYSVEDELKNGFVTIQGGHRVGLCGKAVLEGGKTKTIKDISFLNYRVAKQIIGAADKILQAVIAPGNTIYNTLIISPPQCGKTTLLRDLIRQISNGIASYNMKGKKIGLVDERSEIAACSMGIPRNDVGIRTDVLDGCPKAEGIIMVIRSMSPEIIATDEIGRAEDADAILDAINAGVKVITTIHGSDLEDFLRKPTLQKLQKGLFDRIIIMSRRKGVGTIEHILDGNHHELRQSAS